MDHEAIPEWLGEGVIGACIGSAAEADAHVIHTVTAIGVRHNVTQVDQILRLHHNVTVEQGRHTRDLATGREVQPEGLRLIGHGACLCVGDAEAFLTNAAERRPSLSGGVPSGGRHRCVNGEVTFKAIANGGGVSPTGQKRKGDYCKRQLFHFEKLSGSEKGRISEDGLKI